MFGDVCPSSLESTRAKFPVAPAESEPMSLMHAKSRFIPYEL